MTRKRFTNACQLWELGKVDMKKALKITGIIFGVLMILAVLTYVFGLQLLAKMYVSKKYEYINCTAKEFPYGEVPVPNDWKTVECSGLTVKVPNEVYQLHPNDESEVKRRIFVDAEKDANTTVLFLEWTDWTETEFTSMFGDSETSFSEKDIEKAMKSIDYKCPENMYEFLDFTFNVTSKDFGVIKHGRSPLFTVAVANMKETLVPAYCADCNEMYSFETEKGIGFLTLYGKPNDKTNKYSYLVELYDKNNFNRSKSLIVKSTDKETAFKIAESIEIADE